MAKITAKRYVVCCDMGVIARMMSRHIETLAEEKISTDGVRVASF